MFDIEPEWPVINLTTSTIHSGGAIGADTAWEKIGVKYGVKHVKHYSYHTNNHRSPFKIEISELDFIEGKEKVLQANALLLKRRGIEPYMHLLARNWAQVKYSNVIYAIGRILFTGEVSAKGRIHAGKEPIVDGGTGYAVAMGIVENRPIWVFDQMRNCWYVYNEYEKTFKKVIQQPWIIDIDFAAIGTRNIKQNGLNAIELIYSNTLEKFNNLKL